MMHESNKVTDQITQTLWLPEPATRLDQNITAVSNVEELTIHESLREMAEILGENSMVDICRILDLHSPARVEIFEKRVNIIRCARLQSRTTPVGIHLAAALGQGLKVMVAQDTIEPIVVITIEGV